jgi:hypothetical protein
MTHNTICEALQSLATPETVNYVLDLANLAPMNQPAPVSFDATASSIGSKGSHDRVDRQR